MLQFIANSLIIGLEVYQFIILIQVLSSWFGGLPNNRLGYFIYDLTDPIFKVVKKVPHRVGIIDISPIYAFLLIGILKFVVIMFFQQLLILSPN